MYVIFDTETSGLDPDLYQLLTAGFILLDKDLNILAKREWKFQYPKYVTDPEAMKINKIDINRHHIQADDSKQCLLEINETLRFYMTEQKLESWIVIGHGVSFDINFLKRTETKVGLDKNCLVSALFNRRVIDTQSNAMMFDMMHFLPKNINCSLVSQAAWVGCQDIDSKKHTALGDCELILEVLKTQINVIQKGKK